MGGPDEDGAGVNENRHINYLTHKPVSFQMESVLGRLENNEYVDIDEINSLQEIVEAYTCVNTSTPSISLKDRENIQDKALKELEKMGSVSGVDEHGRTLYNGNVNKDSRLDIVLGLPASGKSSAIVNTISKEFHSRVVDNDEAKKQLPEYNDGWGAGVVHEESKLISNRQFLDSLISHENVVLPKVGGKVSEIDKVVTMAKTMGYTVNVHYVELSRQKAMGRMLNRFLNEGRFIMPEIIDKYDNAADGNKIDRTYMALKTGGKIDGYSKWSNDVRKGERPRLIEADCDGQFIAGAEEIAVNGRDGRDVGGRGSIGRSSVGLSDRQSGLAENAAERNIADNNESGTRCIREIHGGAQHEKSLNRNTVRRSFLKMEAGFSEKSAKERETAARENGIKKKEEAIE